MVFAGSACSGDNPSGATPDAGVDSSAAPRDAASDVTLTHPTAAITSGDIDFGLASCGGMAAGQQTLTIKNTGDADLTSPTSRVAIRVVSIPCIMLMLSTGKR